MTDLYSRAEELRQHATYLYRAYHLTQKKIYAEKLRQLLKALIVTPLLTDNFFASNFTASNIAWCLVAPTICFIITCLLTIVLLPKN